MGDDEPLNSRLRPGRVIDDLAIIGLPGEGSLAKVYLARQFSLGRLGGLNVSAARSAEVRTLAVLAGTDRRPPFGPG